MKGSFYVVVALAVPLALFVSAGWAGSPFYYPLLVVVFAAALVLCRSLRPLEGFSGLAEISLVVAAISGVVSLLDLYRYFPLPQAVYVLLLLGYYLGIRRRPRAELLLARGDLEGVFPAAAAITSWAVVGLALWSLFLSQDSYQQFLPDLPLRLLVVGGLGFALLNAFFEELLFRGILTGVLAEATGPIRALLLQAYWFGAFHYASGFPSGYAGVALAFLFGLGAGWLVYRTGGLFASVLVHAAVDLSIFGLVLLRAYGLI